MNPLLYFKLFYLVACLIFSRFTCFTEQGWFGLNLALMSSYINPYVYHNISIDEYHASLCDDTGRQYLLPD